MTQTKPRAGDWHTAEDERLNDEFHALLRDAADKREGRTRVHSSEDDAAAKQESTDLLALARRNWPAAGETER